MVKRLSESEREEMYRWYEEFARHQLFLKAYDKYRRGAPLVAIIKGLKIYNARHDFSTSLRLLRGKAHIISPRDEAYARLQTVDLCSYEDIAYHFMRGDAYDEEIYYSKIISDGRTLPSGSSRTSVGFEYAKYQFPLLRINSRLLTYRLAKRAVESNSHSKCFCTKTLLEYEDSLNQAEKDKDKDPEKRQVIILPSRENFRITYNQNWEVLQAILKDMAKPYFDRFSGLRGERNYIEIFLNPKDKVDNQDGTLLTQMVFGNYGIDRSCFFSDTRLDIPRETHGTFYKLGFLDWLLKFGRR